eukprot:XP_001695052.1 predicted protein [Chlamydomonas reinhardtii]
MCQNTSRRARPSSRHHSTAAYFPDGSGHNRQPHGAYDDDAGAANGAGQGGPQVQMPGPDLASGGAGGLSGVASRYRTLFAGSHIVRKGLRRSIGDAYAAYVGQVVNLPDDTYALALRALDGTFSAKQQTNCAVDFNLWTSPFATSRAKHAQVFNTAKKIMRDLEGYVYDVSYYCPRQLDELRETRRRGGARTPGGESYKEGDQLQTAEPPLHKEAVPAYDARDPHQQQHQHQGQHQHSPSPQRPRTAPSAGPTQPRGRPRDSAGGGDSSADERGRAGGGGRPRGRGGAAGAARNVSAALDAAAVEEEEQAQRRGMPPGPRRLGFMGEQRLRGLRRLSSPAMYIKTPPHYKISNYYSHVSPTEASSSLPAGCSSVPVAWSYHLPF